MYKDVSAHGKSVMLRYMRYLCGCLKVVALSASGANCYSYCKGEKERLKKKSLLVWISGFVGNTDALKYIFY